MLAGVPREMYLIVLDGIVNSDLFAAFASCVDSQRRAYGVIIVAKARVRGREMSRLFMFPIIQGATERV